METTNRIVHFNNWTNEDFVGQWNNIQYSFPANQQTPIYIADYDTNLGIRDRFAYHLAMRELNKEDITPSNDKAPIVIEYIERAKGQIKAEEIKPVAKAKKVSKSEVETFEEE